MSASEFAQTKSRILPFWCGIKTVDPWSNDQISNIPLPLHYQWHKKVFFFGLEFSKTESYLSTCNMLDINSRKLRHKHSGLHLCLFDIQKCSCLLRGCLVYIQCCHTCTCMPMCTCAHTHILNELETYFYRLLVHKPDIKTS